MVKRIVDFQIKLKIDITLAIVRASWASTVVLLLLLGGLLLLPAEVLADFTDITGSAGLSNITGTYGVAWGDYDND